MKESEKNITNTKKILYISSINPLKGPGAIGMDHYNALKQAEYKIDFLTTYPVEGHPEIKYVLKKPINKWMDKIKRFPYYFLKKFKTINKIDGPIYYFYRKENEPPVPIKKILNKIDKNYDLIIIFFWQGLLTYKTVDKIYDNSGNNPKVYFLNADYSTITGSCHFFGNCRNYESGCGNCPMIGSKNPNDFTAWNFKYRQRIINKIKPYFSVNGYSRFFFEKSLLLKGNNRLIHESMIIDIEKFKPLPIDDLKLKYGIPEHIKFIILFGAQNLNEKRKGMNYLIVVLHEFYNKLNLKDKDEILLLTIGKSDNIKSKLPPFQQKHLGYIPFDSLPEVYSLSNVFVSPSIDDPGPSMVNQSLACGTPVVSFEMGTALDVVKDKGSGVSVPLKDSKAMSEAINMIYNLPYKEYQDMRKNARKITLEFNSYEAFIHKINNIIVKE